MASRDLIRRLLELDDRDLAEVLGAVDSARVLGDGWIQRHNLRRLRQRDTKAVVISERTGDTREALEALANLRMAMGSIRYRHPAYRPGTGPTDEDACRQILDHIGWLLRHLRIYLGETDDQRPMTDA